MSIETDDETGCGLPIWVWVGLFIVGHVVAVSGDVASSIAVFGVFFFDDTVAMLDQLGMIYLAALIVAAFISALVLAIRRDGLGAVILILFAGLNLVIGLAYGYTQTYIRFVF